MNAKVLYKFVKRGDCVIVDAPDFAVLPSTTFSYPSLGIPFSLNHRHFFQAGVENFVFISAAGAQHEHALLRGYWKGKLKAEKAILER